MDFEAILKFTDHDDEMAKLEEDSKEWWDCCHENEHLWANLTDREKIWYNQTLLGLGKIETREDIVPRNNKFREVIKLIQGGYKN